MAVNPFATVQQPAKRTDHGSGIRIPHAFEGGYRRQLIRDRADSADPRDDVWYLLRWPADQQGFEIPRGLEDGELCSAYARVVDHDPQPPLSFDPGHHRNFDHALSHWLYSPRTER